MTGEKKQTIKSLSQELCILKEQVKEIDLLKLQLVELEKIIKNLKINKDLTEEPPIRENLKEPIKCNRCEKSFNLKKKLKSHVLETHPRKIECKTCDKVFSQNCELEVHIKTQHQTITEYQCDLCDTKFVLRWRLLKKQKNHLGQETKKCHYFNNGKICPFEDIGCMFAHELSETCKYDIICSNQLCSYQHTKHQKKNQE